jgi:hypothetical protein
MSLLKEFLQGSKELRQRGFLLMRSLRRMNVVSVVKFKVKDGFKDAFLEALKSYDYSNAISSKTLLVGENEVVTISEYTSIDAIGDDEVTGLEWLDSVTHMLEYFGESRTQSYSGLVAFDTSH